MPGRNDVIQTAVAFFHWKQKMLAEFEGHADGCLWYGVA